MRAAMLALALLGSTAVACARRASPVTPAASVAVYVSGDERASARWPRSLAPPAGVVFRRAELSATVTVSAEDRDVDRAVAAVAAAASAFASADFARCSHALDEVALRALLARSRRDLAARALLWRAACALADDRRADAERAAEALATLELEIPAVVTRPDVEALVASALAAAAARPRQTLLVRSNAREGQVWIDGAPPQCATPCRVALRSGEHFVTVRADRFEPATIATLVVDREASVTVWLSAASASRATEQLRARERDRVAPDSADSMALLSVATAAPRLARIDVERERGSSRMRAVLAIDGVIASRSERRSDASPRDQDADALLRELLVRGRVIEPTVPVYASPWFWVAIGAAAAAGVSVSAWYFTRPIETAIRFGAP